MTATPSIPPGAADLHMHSTASDGSRDPRAAVQRAAAVGLSTIALTDHDTLGGYDAASAEGEARGVRVLAGSEFSTLAGGADIHILGLFIDPAHPGVTAYGADLRRARADRARTMVELLDECGAPITWRELVRIAGDAVIGRPHIAQALVEAAHATDMDDAFTRFIGNDGPAYRPKQAPAPAEVVDLIHDAGGVAVMAHPLVTFETRRALEDFLDDIASTSSGLDGLEVIHPGHDADAREYLDFLVERRGLLPSGGSDCHGPGRNGVMTDHLDRMGSEWIPGAWCAALEAAARA